MGVNVNTGGDISILGGGGVNQPFRYESEHVNNVQFVLRKNENVIVVVLDV